MMGAMAASPSLEPAAPGVPVPPIGVYDARAFTGPEPGPPAIVRGAHRVAALGTPRRVLVVGLTAAGDVLHFLPLASAVRRAWPGARVEWVVQEKARAVVEGQPGLDRIHVFERHRWAAGLRSPLRGLATVDEILAFRRGLRAARPDLLLDPQGTVKSAIVNVLAGAPLRVGFARGFGRELNALSLNVTVVLPTRRMHRVRKSLWLLKALGVTVDGAPARYAIPPDAQAAADATLAALGLVPGGFALMHPGTSAFGARKRWPVDRFGALARRLRADRGWRTLFSLGPVERGWREGLLGPAGDAGPAATEPESLAHLAGLMARAAVVIGSDSAPVHLASNLRVPVVALFGPTDPVLFAPFYPPSVVVVQGLPCPACGAPHCNHSVPRMEAITVEHVLEGVALVMRLR